MPGHYRIPSSSRYLSVESTTVECAKIHLMRVCVRKYQNSKARKWFRGRKHGPRRRRRQNCVCALAHSVHLATLFDRKQSEKGKKKLKRNEIRCNSRSRYDRMWKKKQFMVDWRWSEIRVCIRDSIDELFRCSNPRIHFPLLADGESHSRRSQHNIQSWWTVSEYKIVCSFYQVIH